MTAWFYALCVIAIMAGFGPRGALVVLFLFGAPAIVWLLGAT
jgi:hypothetical protein